MKYSTRKNFRIAACAALLACLGVDSAIAVDNRSPLRGTWSFSQIVPSTELLGTPAPVPIVAVGTLIMDDANGFTGHGVFNTPVQGLGGGAGNAVELDLNGRCTPRNGAISQGLDCSFNFPGFGLANVGRFCVVMSSAQGRCYDEFRCVDTTEPGNTVALIEYRRQQTGTCD